MVKVIKNKGPKASKSSTSTVAGSAKCGDKGCALKSKVTVTKTAVTPKLISLLFLEETPALGTRDACRKKKEEDSEGE